MFQSEFLVRSVVKEELYDSVIKIRLSQSLKLAVV